MEKSLYTRSKFPLQSSVDRAFVFLYGEGATDEQVEAFASTWGGLDLPHFRLALQDGEGDDLILAIFALGLSAAAENADLVAPFLSHPFRRARFASAFCLGTLKDQRAFPVLENLLLDGLDLDEYAQAGKIYQETNDYSRLSELSWCDDLRMYAIYLLMDWNSETLLPILKQTFAAVWQKQQRFKPYMFRVALYDALSYVLGYKGESTFLEDLELPPEHRNTAMLYFVLGRLQIKYPGDSYAGIPDPISGIFLSPLVENTENALKYNVKKELARIFKLPTKERNKILSTFYDNAHKRKNYGQITQKLTDNDDEELEDDTDEMDEPTPIQTTPLCIYQDHFARIQSISWSPTSTHLVSGSEDGTAHVWNCLTGEKMTVYGHISSINKVSWSSQGSWIASGGNDGKVFVWDAWTGEKVKIYKGHQSWIWGGLSWSPDGKKIASASLDGTVQVWDVDSGETVVIYRGHKSIVVSLAWSPDGARIATGGGFPECAIHIWDARTGILQLTYRDHQPDSQRILFGPMIKTLKRNLDEYEKNWLQGASSVHGLVWLPDGKHIVSAGLRSVCRVWDAHSGQNIVESDRSEGPLVGSPKNNDIASFIPGNQIDIWDATTNSVQTSYQIRGMRDINAITWSPDGKYLAASGQSTVISKQYMVQVWAVR